MEAKNFCSILKENKLTFLSGVPCSIFKALIPQIENDDDFTYIPAVREDGALGVASGGYFCGKRSGIVIQNSGLGNIVNGLTSLNLVYNIPVFMFISWRGFQGKDAPEHIIMGAEMLNFLKVMKIPYRVLEEDSITEDITELITVMEENLTPVAAIVKKGLIT